MPKAARITASIPASAAAASEKSRAGQFFAVVLFSGIGLLISLIAIIAGVPGVSN
jgi:hypothetical protein